jgi:hypothetical protein
LVLSTSKSPSRFAKRTWALPIQFGYEQTSIWWITVSRSHLAQVAIIASLRSLPDSGPSTVIPQGEAWALISSRASADDGSDFEQVTGDVLITDQSACSNARCRGTLPVASLQKVSAGSAPA